MSPPATSSTSASATSLTTSSCCAPRRRTLAIPPAADREPVLERVGDRQAADRQCRRQSEHDPAHDGQNRREQGHPPVDRWVDVPRQCTVGQQWQECAESPDGQRHPSNRAHRGERQPLGQQLTNQPSTVCADGNAQGDLAAPGRRADELQVDDVRAGDEQEQQHGGEHRDEELPSGA